MLEVPMPVYQGRHFFLLNHTLFITYDKQYFVTLRIKFINKQFNVRF